MIEISQTIQTEYLVMLVSLETSKKIPERMRIFLQHKILEILASAKTELMAFKWDEENEKSLRFTIKIRFNLNSNLKIISKQVKFQSNRAGHRFDVTKKGEKLWSKVEFLTSHS